MVLEALKRAFDKFIEAIPGRKPDYFVGGLCKDCKWWDKQATIKVETWGRCVNRLKRFAVANTSTLGFPSKYEEMVTSRHFGCIQFEPKTEEG